MATAPVPEVISKSTAPSTVELIVTPPAVAPVLRVTAPVVILRASEIVIKPPEPAVPVPSLAPPEVVTVVSAKMIDVELLSKVTAPPAPPLPSLLLAAALPLVVISAPVKIVT